MLTQPTIDIVKRSRTSIRRIDDHATEHATNHATNHATDR
jgi:hypothetical protein